MGFEKSHLFGKVEVDVVATSTASLAFATDVPGGALAQRFSFTIPITTRTVIRSRLPYNMQGHIVQATCTPAGGQVELYGVRVWTRELPDGEWGWFELPVVKTPVEYSAVGIPVEPTPVEYQAVPIPIEGTPESYNPLPIPIEPTPQSWEPLSLPVKATPQVPQWVPVPVDE